MSPTTYKGELIAAMEFLAADPATCFIGYGIRIGGKALGTLKTVPEAQLIETPVAENLMVGLATGLSLAGRKPVVCIERFDFILNAADAIVNHLAKIETISRGEFAPAAILRVVVGNRKKPVFTGETHIQNFSAAFRSMVDFPVIELTETAMIVPAYREAHAALARGRSTMLVEFKDQI
jgi:pyruvate/2-oxoglutarate/acetoin dehydrogenase E1 component